MSELVLENSIDNNLENSIEKGQNNFLETTLGKAINVGLDLGIRALFPDLIEDQIINIKDTFLNEGFKEGINEIVDSAIDLGKSVIGIFTGKFENISQVQTAVKSGGIIDSTSNLIDFVLNKIQKNDLLSNTTINIIKKGKDLLLDNVNKNIENTLTKQVTSIEKLNEYSENWNKYFELKDFNNMDKEFEKIQNELKEVIPLENTLKQVRKIENIHNLIKNNGQNFDISEIEKELAEKL